MGVAPKPAETPDQGHGQGEEQIPRGYSTDLF